MGTSTFTWMQFDAKQAERAKELVQALSEPSTLDSIGVGPVRDGFASIFFPGTSTLHTRAIYALAIPWALQRVAARKPRSTQQFDTWLRRAELDTIEALVKGNTKDENGIVGRTAGSRTKRLPAELYWNGLGIWGIRNQPIGRGLSRSEVRSMILNDPRGASVQLWDGVPSPPTGFPKEPLAILPTPEQARYLLEKFGQTPVSPVDPGQPSLLARLAREPDLLHEGLLWETDAGNDYLAKALNFAHGFAVAVQGARLRYVDLLFEARVAKDPEDPLVAARDALGKNIEHWKAMMAAESDFLAEWRTTLPDMFRFLHASGANITEPTRRFLTRWCRAAIEDPSAAITDAGLADAIRQREHDLKRGAARLTNTAPLLSWKGELLGSDYLDYRWGQARRLISDCVQGMAETGA